MHFSCLASWSSSKTLNCFGADGFIAKTLGLTDMKIVAEIHNLQTVNPVWSPNLDNMSFF